MRELDRFFKSHRCDIAHGHSKVKSLFFLWAAKRNGVNVRIAHSHTSAFQHMALIGELLKGCLKLVSTHFFACSEIAAIWLFGKKTCVQGRVTIIRNGVDTERFAFSQKMREETRNTLDLSDKFVVGHVGRFIVAKNHIFALHVLHELLKYHHNSILLFIGCGQQDVLDTVVAMAERLGITDKVQFLGLRQDVHLIMQAIDIFILPSLYEGFPVVAVEAQTAGLPCMISDTVTYEARLLESTIYLSLRDSPTVWAERAYALYSEKHHRASATQFVKNAGFDVADVVRQLEVLYHQALIGGNQV